MDASLSEAQELALLAASDFSSALSSGGAQEGASTLRSYPELKGAPESVLVQLAASFTHHAATAVAARRSAAALDVQPLLDLQQLLLHVVAGCGPAEQAVKEAWSGSAAALLYGSPLEAPNTAIDRLCSCTALLPALLAPGSLQRLPPPADHQQRRSMLACLLHLRLLPPPGLPAGAAEALTVAAVPPWWAPWLMVPLCIAARACAWPMQVSRHGALWLPALPAPGAAPVPARLPAPTFAPLPPCLPALRPPKGTGLTPCTPRSRWRQPLKPLPQ